MNSKEMFNSLTSNAIDFLRKSIDEIEDNPKYSIIHFFSAIELFFKARLMLEHWGYIFLKPQDANQNDFKNGNFVSAGFEEIISRLRNISLLRFSEEELKSYNEIRSHRNLLIHFFIPNHDNSPNSATIQNVVSEQCKAWFYLRRWITINCKLEFTDFLNEIYQIDYLMHKNRMYLKVKFENLKKDIDQGKKRGIKFIECESCGFESAKVNDSLDPLWRVDCNVCNTHISYLKIECPECDNEVQVYEFGEGTCTNCGEEISIDFLISKFGSNQSLKDKMIDPDDAYCSECEYSDNRSVVQFNNRFLCLNCLTIHDTVETCEWCGEKAAGDLTNSYLYGCPVCFGRLG